MVWATSQPVLAEPVERPGSAVGATHAVPPARGMVDLGAVDQRNRSQQAQPEARVAQQALAVEHHLDHHVGAPLLASGGRVTDPTQVPPHPVAEPFQGRREDRAVLEAVATTAPADELALHGIQ